MLNRAGPADPHHRAAVAAVIAACFAERRRVRTAVPEAAVTEGEDEYGSQYPDVGQRQDI